MKHIRVIRQMPRAPRHYARWIIKSFRTVFGFALRLPPIFWLIAGAFWVYSLPTSPHLRITYSYTGTSANRSYVDCYYFGMHGGVRTTFGDDCPLLALIRRDDCTTPN